MKVYVMTRAEPFGPEEFVDIKKSRKGAEKEFRKMYPSMRRSLNDCSYTSDKDVTYILFIREKEV